MASRDKKAKTRGNESRVHGKSGTSFLVEKAVVIGLLVIVLYAGYISFRIFYSLVYTYEAKTLINTPRAPEAEGAAIRSVLLDSDNGYAHYYLGAYYYRQGRLDDAREELAKALRTIAHPATPLLLLAEIHLFKKEFTQSLDYYYQTFNMNPYPRIEPGKRWYSFAKAAGNAGDIARAIHAFQKAVDYASPMLDVRQNLGSQFCKVGLLKMALMEFERQLFWHPGTRKFYSDVAAVIRLTGDYDEGIRFFSNLVERDPQEIEARRFLAIFYMQKGKYTDAITQLKILHENYPEDESVLYLMGLSYFQQKEFKTAEHYLQTLIEKEPTGRARAHAEEMLNTIRSNEQE